MLYFLLFKQSNVLPSSLGKTWGPAYFDLRPFFYQVLAFSSKEKKKLKENTDKE